MRTALVTLCLAVSACAPSLQELQSADTGPPPERAAGIAMIEEAIRGSLKDPDSARFEWPNGFAHGWYQVPFGQRYIGWITCGTVNAKNSYGGYTGRTAAIGVISNGAVIAYNVDSNVHRDMPFVAAACEKIGVPAR